MVRRGRNGLVDEQRSTYIDGPSPLNEKFTLSLDCDWLLKPDVNRPGIYMSRTAEEAAEHLQLTPLISLPNLNQIKIKMFHTCGRVEFEAGVCLVTLWATGDWFVERLREDGRSARYEKSERTTGEDWTEPDAALTIVLE